MNPSTAPRSKPSPAVIFRPKSVAIIGMSSKPGAAGEVVLGNLVNGGFEGEIHLVGRSGGTIAGRPVVKSIDELPRGVELAIFVLPAEVVLDTLQACVRQGVKGVVCFASGFAEMGEAGRRQQEQLAQVATDAGVAFLGPNTVGYYNFVDAFYVFMVEQVLPPRLAADVGPAVAVAAQSGGIGGHIAASLQARGVPVSYMMTTGNEAQLGLAELIDFYVDDPRTGSIALYAEQVRSVPAFLAAARRARAAGKPVVMLHPGRSEKSRAAAQSHTGSLAGNHAAMKLSAEQAGVMVVDALEELIDLAHLMLRFPQAPTGGLGLVTMSGALCGISQDYVEPLGMSLPDMAPEQVAFLKQHLPDFLPPRNPLDLGTLVGWKPELVGLGSRAVLETKEVGSLLVSIPQPGPASSVVWLQSYVDGIKGSSKPSIFVMQNEDTQLAPEFHALARAARLVVMRSPERALRALATATRFGRAQQAAASSAGPELDLPLDIPAMTPGPQPEWQGKAVLRSLGLPTPPGGLATSMDEALAVAGGIGYPVVIKAQAAELTHKSDVGGVLLDIGDADALRLAWQQLHDNLARHGAPAPEGVLVEKMGSRGLELVIGASRDDTWGPILMVGLGGVWIEALGDVQLMPPGLPKEAIVARLRQLKGAKLLDGFRGSEPVDLDAVADAVAALGRLMAAREDIVEVDINPLVAYPKGKGVLALDALIVTRR